MFFFHFFFFKDKKVFVCMHGNFPSAGHMWIFLFRHVVFFFFSPSLSSFVGLVGVALMA